MQGACTLVTFDHSLNQTVKIRLNKFSKQLQCSSLIENCKRNVFKDILGEVCYDVYEKLYQDTYILNKLIEHNVFQNKMIYSNEFFFSVEKICNPLTRS